MILKAVYVVHQERELEEACEKWCSRIITLIIFVPILYSAVAFVVEW